MGMDPRPVVMDRQSDANQGWQEEGLIRLLPLSWMLNLHPLVLCICLD